MMLPGPTAVGGIRRSARALVGGLWDEIGLLQFDFMVAQGLKPEHRLLDVGCGCLRGGVHFVRYLDPGHYCGIDKDEQMLRIGEEIELADAGLSWKEPVLQQIERFDLSAVGNGFDFALAQSLFTHLSLSEIERCVGAVAEHLSADGRFYASFFHAEPGTYPKEFKLPHLISHAERDPFYQEFADLERLCVGRCLSARLIGEWDHPRHQEMMVYERTPATIGRGAHLEAA